MALISPVSFYLIHLTQFRITIPNHLFHALSLWKQSLLRCVLNLLHRPGPVPL
jgi:hypothetical protein